MALLMLPYFSFQIHIRLFFLAFFYFLSFSPFSFFFSLFSSFFLFFFFFFFPLFVYDSPFYFTTESKDITVFLEFNCRIKKSICFL